jgi:DNA mismatch repair protein MutS
VILDEIGRGTSTFDGLAIAWAVAEYLDEIVGCRALFATHYHELTALADKSTQVANYSVSAKEIDGDIVFLHRLLKGPASRSYGVAVARLAGLPESVLARAQAILKTLEGSGGAPRLEGKMSTRGASHQLGLFEAPPALDKEQQEVLETLRSLDPDRLTPLEALQLLSQLKKKATPAK